ncbi:hypothetical protein B0H14DRAFT_2830866 [Mycena olivaceomarginata]|nr:hypothetical protein B0H14DRAFT_2830866 [Mycena olivaceomarginata]
MTPSYLLAVPPEIWAQIATLSGRQAIARLSAPHMISTLPRCTRCPPTLLCLGALRNLVDAPCNEQFPGQVVRGAALRAITWDSSTGTDELADFLSTPGYFPNLRELIGYDEWRRAMAALSSSSPLLYSLSLTFDLHVYADSDDRHANSRIPPWAAINQLQLPALTTFEFILYTSGFSVRNPAMDFSPMLACPPAPHRYHAEYRGKLCPSRPQALRHITMLFPGHAAYDIQKILPRTKGRKPAALSPSTLFTPARFPPRAFPGIVSLDARAVDLAGDDAHWARLVDPDALACLAAAFPNLVRLDVSGLVEPLHKYCAGLAALQALEHLCVRVAPASKPTDTNNDDGNDDKTTFPPRDAITAEVNDGLRVLPALSGVRVLVWGDPAAVYIRKGCPSCNGL